MRFSATNRPALRTVVFYSAYKNVRQGTVTNHNQHACLKTPYETLNTGAATLHPEYLYTTREEAEEEAAHFGAELAAAPSTLARFAVQQAEYGKLDADPPEARKQRIKNSSTAFQLFKEDAGAAVRELLPDLTHEDAQRRFAEGMELFPALRDAFNHVHCETYSRAMIEEITTTEDMIEEPTQPRSRVRI